MRVKTNTSASPTLPPIQHGGCQANRPCDCPIVAGLRKLLDSLEQNQPKPNKTHRHTRQKGVSIMSQKLRVQLDARTGFPRGSARRRNGTSRTARSARSNPEKRSTVLRRRRPAPFGARARRSAKLRSARCKASGQPAGLPSHCQHPTMLDDKLEMFLGRCLRPRRSLTVGIDEAGQSVAVACIRCDLQFDSAAEISPAGNLVKYIFQRGQTTPRRCQRRLFWKSIRRPGTRRNGRR